MWPVLLYLFIYLTRAEDVPTDPCHSHHALGLETLIRTSGPIAMAETESIRLRYHKALRYTFSKLERKAKRAQAPDDGPVGSSTMGSTTVSSNSGSTMPGASTTEGSTTGGSTTTAFVPTTASDWNPNCPRPNATMFTVAPPTTNVSFLSELDLSINRVPFLLYLTHWSLSSIKYLCHWYVDSPSIACLFMSLQPIVHPYRIIF